MKNALFAALALVSAAAATPAAAGPIEIGVLKCNIATTSNFIIGSSRSVDCIFIGKSGQVREHYLGSVGRLGIDLGTASSTNLAWVVLAPKYYPGPGALAGGYAGVSAEATLGAGVGANALIGGVARSIVLNPISVQTQTGVNIAAGLAGLTLNLAR